MIKTILRYLGTSTMLRNGNISSTLNYLGVSTLLNATVSTETVTPPVITNDVLLESGSFRLLENGDKLLLG